MIPSYTHPQFRLRQLLEQIPDAPQLNLSAFILGPQFDLHRYTNAEERQAMSGVEFVPGTSGTPEDRLSVPYERKEASHIVDKDYVRLYGDSLEAELAELESTANGVVIRIRGNNSNRLEVREVSSGVVGDPVNIGESGISLLEDLLGRPIQAGDIVYITNDHNSEVLKRTVIRTERAATAPTFGVDATAANKLAANSPVNVDDTDTGFTLIQAPAGFSSTARVAAASFWDGLKTGAHGREVYGDTYTLTVTTGGVIQDARFRLRTTSGLASADNMSAVAVGTTVYFAHPALNGLVISTTIDDVQRTLIPGTRFEFSVAADFERLDTDNSTEANRGLSVDLSGSSYSGPRDTTYVLTVLEGSSPRRFAPIQIQSVVDDDTAQTAANAGEDTGDYYSLGYIPGVWFDPTVAFKRSAAGVVTAVDAADGTPLGSGPITSAWAGKTLYLIENPLGTNYSAEHPYADNHSFVAGARIRITDINGIDTPQEVTLSADSTGTENAFAVGNFGLLGVFRDVAIALKQRGLRKGDSYYVNAVAAANNGPTSTIVLSGQATATAGWSQADFDSTSFNLKIRKAVSGQVSLSGPTGKQYEVGDEVIHVEDELQVYVPDYPEASDRWRLVGGAVAGAPFGSRLFAHFRAFVPAAPGAEIRRTSVVPSWAGKVDLDNPAAYGLSRALVGSQGSPVFFATVPSNDVFGFSTVLRQAENIEGIYAIAAMAEDWDTHRLVAEHVGLSSTETRKMWRRGYAGMDLTGPIARMVVDEETGDNYTATITATEDGNVRVSSPNSKFISNGVVPGDELRVEFSTDSLGIITWSTYTIQAVLDEQELILQTGPAGELVPATKIEVWAPDTARNKAEYVGSVSAGFASRRLSHVWSDSPLVASANGMSVTTPMYAAAEVAGLRSALFPQQGLTRTEISTFAAIPSMYTKYTDTELDIAAARGTMIITQSQPNGPIFIRHQLTTKTDSGLLYYEDSIGTNVDEICYQLKWILQGYVGKRNADNETVQEIRTKMRSFLATRLAAPELQNSVGPALINYDRLFVRINPNNAASIQAGVRLTVPGPLNDLQLDVGVTAGGGESTIEITQVAA